METGVKTSRAQKTLSALLIDMDGTLVDSIPYFIHIYKAFLASYGYEGTEEEFYSLLGPPLSKVVTFIKTKYDLPDTVEELEKKYRTLSRSYYHTLSLFPGVCECLRYAHENDITCALVTAAPSSFAEAFIKEKNLAQYFSAIITADTVSSSKPSPEPYLYALSQLGVKPSDALAIEDTPSGVRSSRGANVTTAMILHNNPPSYAKDHNEDAGVFTVTAWHEIQSYIQEIITP
jgi:HAD superfamily hydrolase (TIGR01509 family)